MRCTAYIFSKDLVSSRSLFLFLTIVCIHILYVNHAIKSTAFTKTEKQRSFFSHTALPPCVCSVLALASKGVSCSHLVFFSALHRPSFSGKPDVSASLLCDCGFFSGVFFSLSLSFIFFSLLRAFKMNGLKNPNIRSSLPPLPLFLCCL